MGIRNLHAYLKPKCSGHAAYVSGWKKIRAVLDAAGGVQAIAVDANNHAIRFCQAHITADANIVTHQMSAWLTSLKRTLGFTTVYLVCDDTTKPAEQMGALNPKSWEWRRRAQKRAANHATLEKKKTELRAILNRRKAVPDDMTRLTHTKYWVRAIAEVKSMEVKSDFSFFEVDDGSDDEGVVKGAKTFVSRDLHRERVLSMAVHLEKQDENRLTSLIAKRHARDAAFLNKSEIVQMCRGVSVPGVRVLTWECDGTEVTEAEDMCARLALTRTVQLVVSEDSDVVPLNIPFTLRVIGEPVLIQTAFIREALELTQPSIIGACVLAGCDMAPYIRNVGAAKAFAAIRKNDTLLMALRTMEAGGQLKAKTSMGKPEFIAHHQWPFTTETCAKCGKKNQDPEKLARDAMTPAKTCKWCGALCCSRSMCWRNHLTDCFVAVCVAAMIEAAKMFDAPRLFAEEFGDSEVTADAFGTKLHSQVVRSLGPLRSSESGGEEGEDGDSDGKHEEADTDVVMECDDGYE